MTHYANDSATTEWLRMLDSLRDDVQCVEFRAETEIDFDEFDNLSRQTVMVTRGDW